MPKMYIKGEEDAINLTNDQADAVRNVLRDPKTASGALISIKLGDGTQLDIRKSEIKRIKDDAPELKSGMQTQVQSSWEEYLADRKKILELTPQSRGERLGLFTLTWQIVTGKKDAPESVLIEARIAQTKFFTDNPKRIYPDGVIMRKIIEKHRKDAAVDSKSSMWLVPGMRLVETLIAQDVTRQHAYADKNTS